MIVMDECQMHLSNGYAYNESQLPHIYICYRRVAPKVYLLIANTGVQSMHIRNIFEDKIKSEKLRLKKYLTLWETDDIYVLNWREDWRHKSFSRPSENTSMNESTEVWYFLSLSETHILILINLLI